MEIIFNVTSQFSRWWKHLEKVLIFSGQASMLSSDTIRVRILLTPDVDILRNIILYKIYNYL